MTDMITARESSKPILFSAPMVRALLDGSKTQTRRILKVPSGADFFSFDEAVDTEGIHHGPAAWFVDQDDLGLAPLFCPYGQAGGTLWVRETWARNWNQLSETRMDRSYVYRADGEARAMDNGTELPWRPSIHMPRLASRITLEITAVRVERLNQISLSDVRAEGCEVRAFWTFGADDAERQRIGANVYRALWESINGPGSWDLNPFVWVIEFAKVRGTT